MKNCRLALNKGRFSGRRLIPIFTGLALVLSLLPQIVLAEVSSTVAEGTLTVVSDGADAIVLTCQEGSAQINAGNPDSGAAECATITHIRIEGGPGANSINASGVVSKEFSTLADVTLAGGEGNDVITGTATADVIDGGSGRDVLAGFKGNDSVKGGAGDDQLIWNNGDGSDRLEGDDGYDSVSVRGAVGKADSFEVAAIGEGLLLTRTAPGRFTLNISDAEKLVIEQGESADSVHVTSQAQHQVIVSSSITESAEAAQPAPMIITGAGDISKTVAAYKLLLGGENNGGEPGSRADGFRTINWDGVPDESAAPNDYPPDFFNAPTAPERGAILSTPGAALQVSADSDNPASALPRFGTINPTYVDTFKAFSEERLFSPVGSNIADLTFFVPGTNTPAVTRGFGAVYADIDTPHTAFEYFDINGNSLGEYEAPLAVDGLSFLGLIFPEPVVHRVRIRYGTEALGPDDGNGVDVAVMDDFIYGEPEPVVASVAAEGEFVAHFQTVDEARLAGVAIDFAAISAAPDGQSYAIWLLDDAGVYHLAGGTAGGELFSFVDPDGANLVGTTAGVAVSLEAAPDVTGATLTEPTKILYAGEVPSAIRPDVRLLVVAAPDTPENIPYDPGMNEQAELALTHAQLAVDALSAGDLEGGRIHAEHIWNILHGEKSYVFGDVNEDGEIQNPGDGFGVITYAKKTADTADRIAESAGLIGDRRDVAVGIGVCARNVGGAWSTEVKKGVTALLNTTDAAEAVPVAEALVGALDALTHGVDADGDGQIQALKGECGAEQAYELSHKLFDIPLEEQ